MTFVWDCSALESDTTEPHMLVRTPSSLRLLSEVIPSADGSRDFSGVLRFFIARYSAMTGC